MGIDEFSNITFLSVQRALTEYRSSGRSGFLEEWGFGESPTYFVLDHVAKEKFDAEAILGASYAFENGGRRIGSGDFNGGQPTLSVLTRVFTDSDMSEMLSVSSLNDPAPDDYEFPVGVDYSPQGVQDNVPELTLYRSYNREEVHAIFSPETQFYPQAGSWGLRGIVSLPNRPGDFVFFVTFGQSQAGHVFDEGIDVDGVLTWQSQPSQHLQSPAIKQFIDHDELNDNIYLFLRTRSSSKYIYFGRLIYIEHDIERERPVHFKWQIDEWDVSQTELTLILSEIGLNPEGWDGEQSKTELSNTGRPIITIAEPPAPSTKGRSTPSFQSHKGGNQAEKDAKNKILGDAGEESVFGHEKAYLMEAGRPDLANRVRHIAREEGDGAGYDVLSYTESGHPKHIEVKTTRGNANSAFYITSNEVAFSEIHPDTFYLYRVYEFGKEGLSMYVLKGSVHDHLKLSPVSYRASIAP